jgi:GTP diphosphokinase / guanosine-3',5'-bis(diphosphate) 3'-diphosphatase
LNLSNQQLEKLKRAYNHAKYAHSKHFRKDGVRYFEHVREVMNLLILAGVKDVSILMAGLLHDTIEDSGLYGNTSIPYENWISSVAKEFSYLFDAQTSLIVLNLTKIPYKKKIDRRTWHPKRVSIEGYKIISKEDHDHFYIKRLAASGYGTRLVKMADRLHNLQTCIQLGNKYIQKILTETESEYMSIFEKTSFEGKEGRFLFTLIRLQILRLRTKLDSKTLLQMPMFVAQSIHNNISSQTKAA